MKTGTRVKVWVSGSVTRIKGDKAYILFDDGQERMYRLREVKVTDHLPPFEKPDTPPKVTNMLLVPSRVSQAIEIELIHEVLNGLPEGWFYIV